MTVQELTDSGAEFVLALSYGKDSLRSLAAIKKLGWPLHRIVHREIWATDTIPADLPPMVEFKAVADKWILDNFGITVEHVCATERQVSGGYALPTRDNSTNPRLKATSMVSRCEKEHGVSAGLKQDHKKTYEKMFYHRLGETSKRPGEIVGFPMIKGAYCIKLKISNFLKAPLHKVQRKILCSTSA